MQQSRDYHSAEDLTSLEKLIDEKTAEVGRNLYRANVQKVADALPRTGSDGKPLKEGRTVKSGILTPYGIVELKLFCGRCQTSGKFECPFKVVFCRGESRALSPLLEERIVSTACETGSYEKASRLCKKWGCDISDDKVLATLTNVGNACSDRDLPKMCDNAAKGDDVLIIMAGGWHVRFRGDAWAEESARDDEERVSWHESKSAVIFKLSEAVDVSNRRRMIINKHILIEPALTTPEAFGERLYAEAVRMGLLQAKKVYVIMDGGTYLWNVFDVAFSALAEGTLDYYHAVQHLGVLAENLFIDEKDPKVKEQWLAERKAELKKSGAKTLLEAIRAAESRQIGSEEAAKAFARECAYFRKHEEHMNYDRNQERGVPIGSGAMESQCSQNQNRFKRRGQFWSEDGFSAASKAYVRYTNDELKYCYRRKAA